MHKIFNALEVYAKSFILGVARSAAIPNFFRSHVMRAVGARVGLKCYFNPGVYLNGVNVKIGDFCAFGAGCYLDGTGELTIGDRVHFGPRVVVLTNTHEIMPSIYRRDRFQNTTKPTTIERGCWLGCGVQVMAGVTIGEGCVVGAGSVVVRDCEPNGLYVGVPALRIKDLPVDTDRPFQNGQLV